MVRNVFHQYAAQRAAAGLALFAILLILVAPLISVSLQQDPMSAMPGMHHKMSMPIHAHHDDTSQPTEMSMLMHAHHHDTSSPTEMSMPMHAHHDDTSPPTKMSMPLHAHHDVATQSMSHPQSMPLDHAEACGYCVLLAHVPGLIFLVILLLLGRVLRIRLAAARQPVQHWHFFPWLCPDTRAPPRVCFS